MAVVNSGNCQAAVLDAWVMTADKENDGRYAWVRLSEGFNPVVLKPGDIQTIALTTEHYASTFFVTPDFSLPLDEKAHRIVLAVRIKSLDARGNVFVTTYPVQQYRIRNEWRGGPTTYYFDCSPRPLLTNYEAPVPGPPNTFDNPKCEAQ